MLILIEPSLHAAGVDVAAVLAGAVTTVVGVDVTVVVTVAVGLVGGAAVSLELPPLQPAKAMPARAMLTGTTVANRKRLWLMLRPDCPRGHAVSLAPCF
jgi:hypothetical protein